jgi:hypothetical protein
MSKTKTNVGIIGMLITISGFAYLFLYSYFILIPLNALMNKDFKKQKTEVKL